MNDVDNMKGCCCDSSRPDISSKEQTEIPVTESSADFEWIIGRVNTATGVVPRVSTSLTLRDRCGTWKARWAVGRMRYRVEPGLYAIGNPSSESPILVSANYKLSFDRLRSQLSGRDAWILVLETNGINVWCAAGKGTFGTEEIIRQVKAARLAEIVSHRTLVVPQLGAPGVAAHEVKALTGFRVVYGPVRAEHLREFLAADMKASPAMRRVGFPLRDRMAVAPVELVMAAKYVLPIAVGFLFLAGLGTDGYSWSRVGSSGLSSAALFLGACLVATVFTPALLPWLPGRAFALKGLWLGSAFLLGLGAYAWTNPGAFASWFTVVAWCLLIPAVCSFLAMNFTGASTYTSLSGVRREIRAAVPIQAICAVVGLTSWLVGRFV